MKAVREIVYLFCSMLLLFSMVAASLGPALAQDGDTGDNTSDQVPDHALVTPAKVDPWQETVKLPAQAANLDPNKTYLAATWSDASVHFLNAEMNDTGSFSTVELDPNALAADRYNIYTADFRSQTLHIYDYDGDHLLSWTNVLLTGAQGLEVVYEELAIFAGTQVHFFNTYGGWVRSIPAEEGTEGLAYDGTLLWLLADTLIGINPADGSVVKSIPNPGYACDDTGTGLAAGAAGELMVGCNEGQWYKVSTLDGTVLEAGNNGLDMHGLASSDTVEMNPVYLRSEASRPWGQTTNEAIMDQVFGAGYWDDLRYETVDVEDLFESGADLIFMEGGGTTANELEAFLTDNQALMEDWVDRGGCLLITSAPNEGDGMSYGFDGVELNYPREITTTTAVDPNHPIFNGPFLPAGEVYTGDVFAYAYITGPGLSNVLIDPEGYVPLAEISWGEGHVAFGGMTTTNFHDPQPNATNLRANLLYYLTTFGCQVTAPPVPGDDGTLFYDNFESGYDNWLMDGLWNAENEADMCGSMVAPFPSPTNAAYYGQDGVCNYDTGEPNSGSLTLASPIALPANGYPYVVFSSYADTECDGDCDYDNRLVEVSIDGGATWNTLGEVSYEDHWYPAGLSLEDYAGENIKLRFSFNSVDNLDNTHFGWMVDDISINTGQRFIFKADTVSVITGLLNNDFDADWDKLAIVGYDVSGLHGTLTDYGVLRYDPKGAFDYLLPNEIALETFSYTVSDGEYTVSADVYLMIVGVDDAPVTAHDYYYLLVNNTLNIMPPGVLGNDFDPDGVPITATLVSDPEVGDLTFSSTGAFSYTPPPDFTDQVSFEYAASDGLLRSDFDPVRVTFAEVEFPLDTPVDDHMVTSLMGKLIPALSFDFEIFDYTSYEATFTTGGPGVTKFNTPPNIEGPSEGTLYITFSDDFYQVGFGFGVSCGGFVNEAITVTAYTADMIPLDTFYASAEEQGYVYAENWMEIVTAEPLRVLQLDFVDDCYEFVVDNITYGNLAAPTRVSIDIYTPFIFLPIMHK